MNNLSSQLQALGLTEMETATMESLISLLYAEAGYSDVDAKDLAKDTGIPINSMRGVLSSLVKKGLIGIDDPGAGFQIVYLNHQFYYLHPEWSNENA